jgi:hypothetical protein
MKTLILPLPKQIIATDLMNVLFSFLAAFLFAQVAPEVMEPPKSALAQLIDQYNGVLNTLTAGAILWLIKFIRDKVKDMFKMYETVVHVTETVVKTQEKVEDIAKTVEDVRKDMNTIKANTSEEIVMLKKQFIEVLEEWADIKRKFK